MRNRIIRVLIAASVASFDAFEEEIWVDLSSDNNSLEEIVADKVGMMVAAIMALLWEAISCATPHIEDIRIDIEIGNITFKGHYSARLLPSGTSFDCWKPELSVSISTTCEQIKKDLTELLTALANGCPISKEGGACSYDIRPR